MKVFLSGNVRKISDELDKLGWSDNSEEQLQLLINSELEIINPNTMTLPDFDCNQRLSTDLQALLECDIVILNATKKCGVGVGAELILANQYKIPVFTIAPINSHYHKMIDGKEWWHSFIYELSDNTFDSLESLCDYINYLLSKNLLHKNTLSMPSDVIDRLLSFDGGYDDGYKSGRDFWGNTPAAAVVKCSSYFNIASPNSVCCLDAGCGHGKNAIFLSEKGFSVDAIDASYYAVREAKSKNKNVNWRVCDIRKFFPSKVYDIVLMTGSLHCLHSESEIIATVKKLQLFTKIGGYNVLSSFNNEYQDMSGHLDSFHPTLLSHQQYLDLYADWNIVEESTVIQNDVHPNNNIVHKHSITRILAQRIV